PQHPRHRLGRPRGQREQRRRLPAPGQGGVVRAGGRSLPRRPPPGRRHLAVPPTNRRVHVVGRFRAMRFGLDVAQQRMSWDEVVSRVQFAEDLGFDGAWGFDHFQPMYGDGVGETFEGMTTLAALAGVTSRIRLGLMVAGVTYRHPSVFAAEAITIDHASHGRLELSLGAAWFDKE